MKLTWIKATGLTIICISVLYSCSDSAKEKSGEAESKEILVDIEKESNEFADWSKKIASETQAALAKNLMAALSNGGPEYAIEFCNTNAIRLTDSMSLIFKASIRRISDKPRNPMNEAVGGEVKIFKEQRFHLSLSDKPVPSLIREGDNIIGYFPIITNAMCLQCHGKKHTDIQESTLLKIQKLYPADQATGYANNELRGFWVVEINRK